jgi:hypothetical protein
MFGAFLRRNRTHWSKPRFLPEVQIPPLRSQHPETSLGHENIPGQSAEHQLDTTVHKVHQHGAERRHLLHGRGHGPNQQNTAIQCKFIIAFFTLS